MEIDYFLYKDRRAGNEYQLRWYIYGEGKMTVATIPVGYADGMKRDLSGKGRVLIHGQYAPILGRICMDQFMVDVSHIKEAAIGDTVTIFGKDGEKISPLRRLQKNHIHLIMSLYAVLQTVCLENI